MPLEAIQPGATALTRTPACGPLEGGGLGQVDHAGARRAGVPHARHAVPEVGRHVDDGAAVLLHGLREDLAHHQEAAGEVVGDDGLEALLADGGQRRGELPAGVVDEAVDAAEPATTRGHAGLHGVLVADVEGALDRSAPPSSAISAATRSSLSRAPADHHVRAQRRQLVRDAAADARAAAGDPDALAGEQARAEHAVVVRRAWVARSVSWNWIGREGNVNVNLLANRELR